MIGGFFANAQQGKRKVSATRLRQDANLLTIFEETRLAIEVAQHIELTRRTAHNEWHFGSFTGSYVEETLCGQHAAIGQARTRNKQISACIQVVTALKGVCPGCSLVGISVSFLEVQQLRLPVYNLTQGEVAVIFGVGRQQWRSRISKFKLARGRGLALCVIKIHVYPCAVALVLHLTRNRILARLDAQATRHAHKEDVARTRIGKSRTPNAHRCLRYTQGLGVGIEPDVVFRPFH